MPWNFFILTSNIKERQVELLIEQGRLTQSNKKQENQEEQYWHRLETQAALD